MHFTLPKFKMKTTHNFHFIFIFGVFLMLATSCKKDGDDMGTVTDVDGNVYHTVVIGTQVWMVENLRVTKFNDGSSIDLGTIIKSTLAWPDPKYSWYNNDPENKDKYGALYNYRVVRQTYVVQRSIAPQGWRIPSDDDWNTLISYLGGEVSAGGKMKAIGTIEKNTGLWHNPNAGATNEKGFSAVSCGNGFFESWWSSEYASDGCYSYIINNSSTNIVHSISTDYNSDFKSIRCIKN
jgi:uncharacterized protein (TIGR02145 family)